MNAIGRAFIGLHVWVFRATKGGLGGSFGKMGQVLLLTTTGRKTGVERTVPIMFVEEGGERFVIASNNGAPVHPAWYHNLKGKARVRVEVPGKAYDAEAVTLEGEEREAVFGRIKAKMPQFQGYEDKVAGRRLIPVVRLREAPAA